MFHRPKIGESEEDILRQEEEFLKVSGKQPQFKRKIVENEVLIHKRQEIVADITEKNQGVFKAVEPKFESKKGFPQPFVIDVSVMKKKKRKKSLFAMQLEKNKNIVGDLEEEEEETLPLSQDLENSLPYQSDMKRTVHEENVEKMSKLSEEEILKEQKNLLDNLDPKLVEFLKTRVKAQKDSIKVPKEEKVSKIFSVNEEEEEMKKNLEKYVDSRWVNIDFLEKEKLEWIGDIPDKKSLEPNQPYSARFDFKGDLQPFSTVIDVRNSLYHHGDEPSRPGYTIQELYQLSRSQVLQQRNVALTTLGNIIRKTKLGYYDKCFDGQMLHKLIESDLFFLLRFSIDENSSVPSSIYCLHNLICNESDEFCLDKCLGISYLDEQPLLYNKIEASEDEEKELKDHVVIGCDLIKGVLRTDLLIRLSYVLNNFSPNRETIVRAINCLVRISRHSLEATSNLLQVDNLLKFVYKNIRTEAPVYEGVKLFRVMVTNSKEVAMNVVQNYDFRFLISFIETEENSNISKKEFYLLKLEVLYFWRGLLLHDMFVDEFVQWSPSLIRLLLFYTQKVDLSAENDFDFELFSAMTTLIIVCNRKKIPPDTNTAVMMRFCLEKWLTQLVQLRQYNFSVSKALGCAFRYFSSHFKAFGVTALDLDFIKKINSVLISLFNSEIFNEISLALKRHSYLLSPSKVVRDPENLPSLCSVYEGGHEFLKIVQNSSSLPFFISLAKYLKAAYRVSHDTKLVIKLFVDSPIVKDYISEIFAVNENIYNWFMKFETEFLTDFIKLLLLIDGEALSLGFSLLPLLRVDDVKSKKILKVLLDKNNWKVDDSFFENLFFIYSESLLEEREQIRVMNYKNDLIPEDWPYKVLSLMRGKEAGGEVADVLKFISLILVKKPDLIKRVPYSYRFYNSCSVFLTDSNVFDFEIKNALEKILEDVFINQRKVNLNMKFGKKKSFYDFYTELITQYAGVSYGLPLFAKLVMFPLQNRFNVSFRKLLWFEYLHVLRVVMIPWPVMDFIELKGFLEPCETDESLLVAYFNSVSNNVITKAKNGLVYTVAVGNINCFLKSTDQDKKLLMFLQKKVNDLKNNELKNDILNFNVKQ